MENQVLIALKNNKLLKNILFDDLKFHGVKGKLLTVYEGEILFREGEKANNIYLVVSGEVNLLKKRPGNKALSFIINDHDFFGCDEFVEKKPRSSTAVALRDSYIISLTRTEVDLLIEQNDEILKNIYDSISEREPDSIETHIPDDKVEKVNFRSVSKDKPSKVTLEDESEKEEVQQLEAELPASEDISLHIEAEGNVLDHEPDQQFFAEEPIPDEVQVESDLEESAEEESELKFEEEEKEGFSLDDLDSYSSELGGETEFESALEDDALKFDDEILKNLPDDDIPKPEGEIDISSDEEKGIDLSLDFAGKEDSSPGDNISDSEFNFDERFGNVGLSFNETESPAEPEADKPTIKEDADTEWSLADEIQDDKIPPEKILEDKLDLSKFEDSFAYFDKDENVEDAEIEKTPEEKTDNAELVEEKHGKELAHFKTLSSSDMDLDEDSTDIPEEWEEGPIEDVKEDEPKTSTSEEVIEEKKEPELQPEREKVDTPVYNSMEDFSAAELIEKLNKAAERVNSNLKIDDVLQSIVNAACDLTYADRGTLYIIEKEKKELWSKIAIGNEFKEIKLKLGEGIAGHVAESGETVNIDDVQNDPHFSSRFDRSSGYVTKSMLCFPIRNKNNEIVGVLQLLNSKNNKFSKVDEEFLKALSTHAALALQNAELVEKLLSSERVSSLGKMTNFLIQDIKKPIMVGKRYAEHLKTKDLPEDAAKVLNMLLDQLNHIADLVQSISNYSEGDIVLRSIIKSVNEVLDDCISRDDSFVQSRNCHFNREFDKNVNVKISEKQFYQAFHHIVKNACDAMPDGGEIMITTKRSDNSVEITFKDNGLGIPESLHEKIFEPFMSHGKREGTGLGLSITKKIIEEHGGSIKVQSETGEGAKFIVTLPIVKSAV